MKTKDRIMIIISILLVIGLFIITFIDQFQFTKVEKEDLIVVTETYESYKKSKYNYDITCESGNKYKLSLILGDDEHLEFLKSGDIIVLSLYDNRVVEMSVNGQIIITIDDCITSYKDQIMFSSVFFPIIISIIIASIIISNKFLNRNTFSYNNKKVKTKVKVSIDSKLYNSIQKSIYKKDGYIRCNILEQLDRDDFEYTFYKAIVDYIDDNEIVVMIDDGCKDDEMAFIFYKNQNKLYQELLFREGETPFEIDVKLFSWEYPFDLNPSKEEQKMFKYALNEYILNNSELLRVKK